MRKSIFYLPIVLLVVCFSLFSCAVDSLPVESNISEQALQKVNPVFLKHDMLEYGIVPNWDGFFIFDGVNGVEVFFRKDNKMKIPMSENKKNKGRERLLLTLQKDKVVATLIEYRPSNDYLGDVRKINCGNFKKMKFSGEVTFRGLDDTKKIIWYLKDGQITRKAIRQLAAVSVPIQVSGSEAKLVLGTRLVCTADGWICFGDGAEIQFCTTTWTCSEEEYWYDDGTPDDPLPEFPTPDPLEPLDFTDCSSNYWPWCDNPISGGAVPPLQDDNLEECKSREEQAKAGGVTSNQLISSYFELVNAEKKVKVFKWEAFKFLTYMVGSVERGTIIKIGSNNEATDWKFEDLEHLGMYQEGNAFGFEVQHTFVYSNPTIGVYSSIMEVGYTVKISTECIGGAPTIDEKFYQSAKPFLISDF